MKNLYITKPEHLPLIQQELDKVYGKIDSALTIDKILSEIKRYTYFSQRLMKGAKINIYCNASIPKAYKYKKEIGACTLEYTEKEWKIVHIYQAICWPGRSTGESHIQFLGENSLEITSLLCKEKNISFATVKAV